LEAGLAIALSPVQLAAVLSDQAISDGETTANRLWGGLKLLGGSLEMVGAAALFLAPEPTLASKAGGAALAAHGSDTLSAGLWQVFTGQEQRSLTERGAAELALRLGADAESAGKIGTAVDIAVPLAVSVGLGGPAWLRSALDVFAWRSTKQPRVVALAVTPWPNMLEGLRPSCVRG
jgi:hypothetical protein